MVQDVANAEGDKRRRVQVSERREVPWRRWRRSSAADMNEEEGVDDVGGRRGWIDLSTIMHFFIVIRAGFISDVPNYQRMGR